ncbi:MAG: DUF4340 domain-containing protein [Brevinematia bacterium]
MNRLTKKYAFLTLSFVFLFIIWGTLSLIGEKSKSPIPKIGRFKHLKKIEISSQKAKNITLVLSNDSWYISPENFEVDEDAISQLTNLIENFEVVDFVSKSIGLSQFELDEKNRSKLTIFYNDNKSQTIYFGKFAPTKKHTYIQFPEDTGVYLCKGNFYFAINKTKEEFRSKKILSFNNEEILSINWTESDKEFSIFPLEDIKTNFKWGMSWLDSREANASNVRNFLLLLNPLYAIEFLSNVDTKKPPLRNMTIKTKSTNYEITLYSQDKEGDYLIGIKGKNEYYKITKFAGDNLMKSHTNF